MINKYKEIFVQGTHWNLMFLLFDFAVDIPRFIFYWNQTQWQELNTVCWSKFLCIYHFNDI